MVSATPSGPSTVFSYRLNTPVDWLAALGADLFVRAKRAAFVTAIPAGRWMDGAAYALVASVDWNGDTILVGLREDLPFDAVEAVGAAAAARMLEMIASEGRVLAETLRQSDSLEGQLRDIARRMHAGAASIMVVEGDELRVRAAIGLPSEIRTRQRIGEGIAGYAAARGEKLVLRGPVNDDRFRGFDPDAREAIVVPLREGSEVLGVLNLKRPEAPDGFAEGHALVDGIAAEVAHTLRSMDTASALARDRDNAQAAAEIARAVAGRDIVAALEQTLQLGHHAVAVRDRNGVVLGVRSVPGDEACYESALTASEMSGAGPHGAGVGFARHGSTYSEDEAALTRRTADTLAFLARDIVTDSSGAIRVLAVEDHPVMRLGIRSMLEREGFVVAGATATVGEAIGMLPDAAVDVVLLDLHLPDATGAEAVTRLRDVSTTLPILVFSIDRTPGLVRAVLRAGANGYVAKDAPVARIVAALMAAASGLVAMGPDEAIAAAAGVDAVPVISGPERTPPERTPPAEPTSAGGDLPHDAPHDPLTPRELELLRYMAEGYTNKEVARAMVLAEDTVKKAVQTLIAKLGAADRTHAVVLALRAHLID
ncbi:MAG TPA: response regulator [Candidatus Acidoferrales bacterium]|nr:response regulator [Candidatus Acidoferrales bacterium]